MLALLRFCHIVFKIYTI